jgi:hypothetical protein
VTWHTAAADVQKAKKTEGRKKSEKKPFPSTASNKAEAATYKVRSP